MKEEVNYNANDLHRYHNGTMPPAERHQLEKAALDDPFLADALEGYALPGNHTNAAPQLQQKLEARINKKQDSRLRVIYPRWLQVAAMFLLLAGAGWLFFKPQNGQNTVAVVKTDAAPESTATAQAAQALAADTLSVTETVAVVPQGQTAGAVAATTPATKREKGKINATEFPQISIPQQPDSLSLVYQSKEAAEIRTEKKDNDNTKRVVAKSSPAAITDSLHNLNIVMQKADVPAAEEVVVTRSANRAEKSRRNNVTVDTLESTQSLALFEEYITNNLRYPDELKTKKVSGSVELAFDINKDGTPVNIAVTKSLCAECDEEAVRLLKEGPKWKKKSKKGKVKIKF